MVEDLSHQKPTSTESVQPAGMPAVDRFGLGEYNARQEGVTGAYERATGVAVVVGEAPPIDPQPRIPTQRP